MATNLQEALASGTPAAAGARPITMESLPEASIDVEGGASSLEIEGLGVKKSKDGLSAGTTSSTASISTEDFFADLLAETDFNNADSVFSFRNGVIERISETDPATLSSLTASSLTAPSQAAASPSASTPSPSGFDTLFGSDDGGGGGGEDASYGSLDSDSSGSFSEAEATSSAYSDAERAGMAGVVGKGLGALQGLASGRDFSAASLATSALSSTGTIGDAYGAYSSISGLAGNLGGVNSVSGALGAVSAAIGAVGAISSVADAATSGKSFSEIAEAAFDNALGVAQTAWSAIQDPAAALDAFGEMAQYGSINATNLSYSLPSGLASYSFNSKTGQLNTPGFISMMMGLSPLGNAFSLAQKGLSALDYTDAMTDRAHSFASAFGSSPGVSANTAEATGIDATSYGALGTITDFSFDVAGMQGLSMQADLSAIDATWSSISMADLDQASVTQANLDYEEQEVANQALSAWGIARAEALGLDPNSKTNSQEAAQAMASIGQAAKDAYTDAMDQMGYGFSALSNVDEAFSTSDPAASLAERGFAAQAYQSARQEAMSSFSQSQSISDEAMASSFGAYAAMEALGALDEDIAQFAQVSVNFADLTQAEKNSIANSYSTTAQSAASLSAQGQAAAESYNAQTPDMDVVEAMQQLGLSYISMNAYQDLDKKEALANQMALNALNADNASTGFSGAARGSGGVDEASFAAAAAAGLAASYEALSAIDDADSQDSGTGPGNAGATDAPDASPGYGGYSGSEGGDGGGGGDGGKIICTAMNQMYGFGSYRNALWMKYQKSHMAAEEYELGYHKLIMPLVKKMPTNKTIRTALERVAKRRTINIRKELRGQKLPLYYRSMKYTVRPLFFAVGWLVKKKILSKVKV